ncbi:MAG: alpha/beta hydrolase family protein [Lactovum sp.]
MYGGKDELVSVNQSEIFYKVLIEVGAEVTYLYYSLEMHGLTINKFADNYVYEFLKNHI